MNRILAAALISAGLLGAACGSEPPKGRSPAEEVVAWEGIGLWDLPADTALMSSIKGEVTDTPDKEIIAGGLRWHLRTVENLSEGIARVWPSITYRWVAVRLDLSYAPGGSGAVSEPRAVIFRDALVLVDNAGHRHLPVKAHDRILPRIDSLLDVDTLGMQLVVVFPVPRSREAASLEIHDPLQTGRIEWRTVSPPTDWIVLDRKVEITADALRRLWEVRLDRVRISGESAKVGEAGRLFEAELTLRNITSVPLEKPDARRIRLYTGSARSIASMTGGDSARVEPGKTETMAIVFMNVPAREALDVVVPYRGDVIRFDAYPGFYPEKLSPLKQVVVSGGLRGAIYRFEPGADRMRVLVGLTHQGSSDLPVTGLTFTGLDDAMTSTGTGSMANPPEILYPGFEERRWVDLPRNVTGLKIEIAGRKPVILRW